MSRKRMRVRLTPDHVGRVVSHAGEIVPVPFASGAVEATEADHREFCGGVVAQAPAPGEVWVFGYGSLIWNPAFDFVEQRVARARGFHRSFCLGWDSWFRGSQGRPSLMLALDLGGQCEGVAFRLPPDALEDNLMRLALREMPYRPHPFPPRWIKLQTANGPLNAICFVIDRKSPAYVGGLSLEVLADMLATAIGQRGSMAEYLLSTVEHLDTLGLRDRYLWALQAMVAERIDAKYPAAAG